MPVRELFIVCALMCTVMGWSVTQFFAQNFINVDANGRPLISDARRTNKYFAADEKVTLDVVKKYRNDFPITGEFADTAVQLRMLNSNLPIDEDQTLDHSEHDELYSSLEELSEL